MAKRRKNKSGLHKDVSSVLNGVHIPHGVHNWQPPDKFDPDRTDSSSAISESSISSIFKGVPVPHDDSLRPTRAYAQDHRANIPPFQPQDGIQTSQNAPVKNLDCSEESSGDALGTEQVEFMSRVVHYRNPLFEEAPKRNLWKRIREKLFGAKD
jgi:hypothetical protein